MKDAIGGSLLLNLVVIFTSIIILFFAGILAYSKAYKVKNKIVEVIEAHDGQIVENGVLKDDVKSAINTELTNVGYRVSVTPSDDKCTRDSVRGKKCAEGEVCTEGVKCTNLNTSEFNYCICEQSSAVNEGISYEVITYVHFAFPVIGDLLTFPVRGETRVLGKDYNY